MELLKQLLEAFLEATQRKENFTIEVKNNMVRLIPVNDMFTQVDILLLTRFATENGYAYFVSVGYGDNKLRWVIYEPKPLFQ